MRGSSDWAGHPPHSPCSSTLQRADILGSVPENSGGGIVALFTLIISTQSMV